MRPPGQTSKAPTEGLPVSRTTPTRVPRLEALAIATASLIAYSATGSGWGLYFGLWLIPDLAIALYLASPKAGSVAYNLTHTLVFPVLLCSAVLWLEPDSLYRPIGLIWLSRVAIDRALGFGLKYPNFFKDTHLARTRGNHRPLAVRCPWVRRVHRAMQQ